MQQPIKRRLADKFIKALRRISGKIFSKSGFSEETYQSLKALKCVVSYNKYGGYCVPLSSQYRPAAKRILNNDIYEPDTISFLRNNCGKGDIVHAGTYFGDFLPGISAGCDPDAKIWAFEPNPENFRCANITLLINELPNVVLTNAGLGQTSEQLFIKTLDDSGQALGGASRITGDSGSDDIAGLEKVDIVAIDDIIPIDRKVSIIQLDVEGHEEQALKGAMKTIKKSLPILILEDLSDNTLFTNTWFKDNILSLGYQLSGNLHGNKVFTC